jgi:hypothetical protein
MPSDLSDPNITLFDIDDIPREFLQPVFAGSVGGIRIPATGWLQVATATRFSRFIKIFFRVWIASFLTL